MPSGSDEHGGDATVRESFSDGPRRRLYVAWEEGSRRYPLPDRGTLVIGRADDCDIRIPHASISRRHALLHADEDVCIEDLESANGTRVGGEALAPGRRARLMPGFVAHLASAIVAVESDGNAIAAAAAGATESSPHFVVGTALQPVRALATKVALGDISVLIVGETGVGKERFAELIQQRSPRAHGPFIKVNCAALADALIESELFGYERGAFTGAQHAKPGLLEAAQDGTLFLDEVGELSLGLQAKLLRAVESHEILRVGAVRARSIDVRFIAATNRQLDEQVANGRFRRDLFFRLAAATLVVPPLRERRDEIEPLARRFLEAAARSARLTPPTLSSEALARLLDYAWPGNVRELKNVMSRAALVHSSGIVTAADVALDRDTSASVPLTPRLSSPPPRDDADAPQSELRQDLRALEMERIVDALARCGGNRTRAAELLGIPRRTMLRRIAAYGIPPKRGPSE